MSDPFPLSLLAGAVWLGILTSISPCPLATNIAAVSYIGRKTDRPLAALLSGCLYAGGRSGAYILVGTALSMGLASAPSVSFWLQTYMNRAVGPLLILVGVVISGWMDFGLGRMLDLVSPLQRMNARLQGLADQGGMLGAAFLGFCFALSFCPVSAALFFGSLIPMITGTTSGTVLPLLYGLGTALPVLGAGWLMAAGGQTLGRVLDRVDSVEKWTRRLTAAVFIGAGLYFTINYTLFPEPSGF